MDNNNKLLVVQVNGTPMIEYDRDKILSETQKESLSLMEEKLNQGFRLGGVLISDPKHEQKIEFVTANLISAILDDNEVLAAASCAYIANSLPDLKQVKAFDKNGEVSIELIFDRAYQQEEKLNFTPLEKITTKPH